MATTKGPSVQRRRVLFTRVGWMRFYSGRVLGDERPVGGGSYNKSKIGHEVYNFRETGARLYGYFQPMGASYAVALERIDLTAVGKNTLDHVLVLFVARHPDTLDRVIAAAGHDRDC
jgi:hypothetical protein